MKYQIEISEPWDFTTSKGSNIIIGEIVKVLTPSLIIFKSEQILDFNNCIGRILILIPRHEEKFSCLKNTYSGTVNGAVFANNEYSEETEEFLIKNCTYAFIGTLEANS